MANRWALYLDTEITRDKNRIIDNLEGFLEGIPTARKIEITNGQFFKHGLKRTLKVNLNQEWVALHSEAYNIDYVAIRNEDDNITGYYFVDEKKWLSENCVELRLTMDTLNTYKRGTNYELADRTTIKRLHKNRIDYQLDDQSSLPTKIWRKIDKISEGFNPALYRTSSVDGNFITDRTYWRFAPEDNYYLIFRMSENQLQGTRSVDAYISQDTGTVYKKGLNYSFSFNKNDIASAIGNGNRAILKFEDYNQEVNVSVLCGTAISTSKMYRDGYNNQRLYTIELVVDSSGNVTANQLRFNNTTSTTGSITRTVIGTSGGLSSIAFSIPVNGGIGDGSYVFQMHKYTGPYQTPKYNSDSNGWFYPSYTSLIMQETGMYDDVPTYTASQFKNYDRADTRTLKIIMLPYFPGPAIYDPWNNLWRIDTSVIEPADITTTSPESGTFTFRALKIKKVQFLTDVVELNMKSYYDPLDVFTSAIMDLFNEGELGNPEATRMDVMESKIYHSDFYCSKYVYDTFAYQFKLEDVNYNSDYEPHKFRVNFIPSYTMQSKFMFYFPDYDTTGRKTEDYEGYMPVSRNNEMTLYTDAYLQYMQSAYNWDQKAKAQQAVSNYIGIGTSVLGVIGSVLATVASEGALAPVLVASTATLAGTLANAVNSTFQAENNQQSKMDQLRHQNINVAGIEDVDLLRKYGHNKLKEVIYQLSDTSRKVLCDLFYFCGYKCEYQDVPDVTTRYWFNFVQADVVFDETTNLSSECAEDIKARYAEGVTVMHYHPGEGDDGCGYNFKQDLENWENKLVEYWKAIH